LGVFRRKENIIHAGEGQAFGTHFKKLGEYFGKPTKKMLKLPNPGGRGSGKLAHTRGKDIAEWGKKVVKTRETPSGIDQNPCGLWKFFRKKAGEKTAPLSQGVDESLQQKERQFWGIGGEWKTKDVRKKGNR